jgi:uncharacterized protein YkwD
MRRKPVVVSVAAVLLAVGGVAATRAWAEETPDWTDVPGFSLSDVPGFSGFADDSGDDSTGDSGVPGDDSADSGNGFAGDDDGSARGGTPPSNLRGQSDGGGGDDAVSRGGSGSDTTRAGDPVQKKPSAPKAAAVAAEPGPALDRQDAGGSLVAEAKRDVTAADISESPSAPTQQQVLSLINGNRRAHGCRGVTLDRRLIEAANGHAADMARHDYFAHESPDGQSAGDRVTKAGYNWRHYGENIARGVDSAYAVVDGWMHSPGHRHNILDCTLDQMGVGVAIAGDRKVYWVQDFASPM